MKHITQPKPNSIGLMAALLAAATWGLVGIFVRWLPGWSTFAVLAGRFLVATAAMLPIVLLVPSIQQDLTRSLRIPPIWWLSLLAIGSSFLGTTAFQMAPVGEVTLLFTTSPLFIIAYKYVMRLDIKRSEGWGILIATAGVIIILLPQFSSDRAISWQTILGYLLALGAAAMVTLYTVLFDTFTDRGIAPKSINIVFMTCLLGGVLFPFCTIFFTKLLLETSIERQEIFVLLGLGIFSTALPFFCYTVAAQKLPIVLTTAILLLEPMFAVLFTSVALQEIPSLWFGIGSILVFWGLRSIARAANSS
ncbi:DMT family transporter [Chamaesiphon sp. OTE_8_metabat_110]|uniref:DMT family transporter n=2 Tax=unclassified Chamaesiphon TaxID=2620921 RepID=UPI00286CFD0D|nr:DMT family transporter [Chamaesiphon sp. OTE_8_metabat_110]